MYWYSGQLKSMLPSLACLENLRILSGDPPDISEEELCTPALFRLTHLEIICYYNNAPKWDFMQSYLQQFQLTHLRMCNIKGVGDYPIKELLDLCTRLRVFIITVLYSNAHSGGGDAPRKLYRIGVEHPRLVLLDNDLYISEDGTRGIRGFYDSWTFAKHVVTARQSEHFPSLCNPLPQFVHITDTYFKAGSSQQIFHHFDLYEFMNEKGSKWYEEECKRRVVYL